MPTTTTGVATEFINFTRASNATVTDSNGLIDWAAHNLLLASEQFDSASWAKNNATVAANAIAAPNGTTTADTMTATGTVAGVVQAYSAISGQLTASVFAKAGTNSSVTIRIAQAGNGYETAFTLTGSGTAGTPAIVGTGGTVTGMTAAITALSDGWYRCTITYNETNLGNVFIIQGATSGTVSIWGAHLYRSDLGGMQANTSAYPMYNPTTAKNLLGYTEDFGNAAWGGVNLLAFGSGSTLNAAGAPNGINTADKIVESTAAGIHSIAQTVTTTASVRTFSVYLKRAERSFAMLYHGVSNAGIAINLDTGATNTPVGIAAPVSSSATPVGDGWYRCSISVNATAATNAFGVYLMPSSSSYSYTGDGVSGIYLWGAQLSDSASLDPYVPNHFTAPSAAAYYGPRRDFDPVTLACKGLLVEEQRANLLLHTAAFDAVVWSLNSCTIAANAGTAPDGSSSADKVVSAAATASTGPAQSVTSTTVAHTFSIYAKAAGATFIQLLWNGPTSSNYANFDLSLGALTAGTYTDAKITSVGNSWYRISITSTSASTTITANAWLIDNGTAARGTSFTGDGTKGVLVWGAQLELGSFATSYIPTTTASATRSADVAQVSTAAFPYSATESTLVANCTLLGSSSSSGVIAALQLAASPGGLLLLRSSNSLATVAWVDASFAALGTADTTNQQKLALAYNGTANGSVRNGGTVSSVGTTISGPATKLVMGCDFNNSSQLNGHIRQITYIPRRLSNAELQTRTV